MADEQVYGFGADEVKRIAAAVRAIEKQVAQLSITRGNKNHIPVYCRLVKTGSSIAQYDQVNCTEWYWDEGDSEFVEGTELFLVTSWTSQVIAANQFLVIAPTAFGLWIPVAGDCG